MMGLPGFDMVAEMELDYSRTSPALKTRNESNAANDAHFLQVANA